MNDNKGKLSILCVLGFAFAILAPCAFFGDAIVFFLRSIYVLPQDIMLNWKPFLSQVTGFAFLILGFVLSVIGTITSTIKHKRGIGFGIAGYLLIILYLTLVAVIFVAVVVISIFWHSDDEWKIQPHIPQETAETSQSGQIEAGDIEYSLILNDDYSISRNEADAATGLCWHIEHNGVQILDRTADLVLEPEYQWLDGATGTFIASTGDLPGTNRLEIDCELGKIVCEDGITRCWKLPQNERDICYKSDNPWFSIDPDAYVLRTDGLNPQHIGVLNAFAAHLLHGGKLIAEKEDGLREMIW